MSQQVIDELRNIIVYQASQLRAGAQELNLAVQQAQQLAQANGELQVQVKALQEPLVSDSVSGT